MDSLSNVFHFGTIPHFHLPVQTHMDYEKFQIGIEIIFS